MKPKGIRSSEMQEGIHRVLDWMESVSNDFYADYINENLKLNMYKIKHDFFKQFNQYVIVRRGMSYIIQDNFNNKELLYFPFNFDNQEHIHRKVLHTCDMLNEGNLIYRLENNTLNTASQVTWG